jgi:HAD superfamily hydrolase (TIGR01509 family)
MIQTIVFDLNGVIIDGGAMVRENLAKQGFNKDKLYDAISGEGTLGSAYLRGEMSYEAYCEGVKELFPRDYLQIIAAYDTRVLLYVKKQFLLDSIIHPYDLKINEANLHDEIEVLSIVEELSRNYSLVLFSGSNPTNLAALDARYHFLQYFHTQILSYQVGADKPSSKMFDAMAAHLPTPPDTCLYLDDNPQYIRLGEQKGLHGVVFAAIRKEN